ncbi:hypothetical protein I545_3158 [Mycobacterium kansasii 662]|uniref:Uncharacterized protein n=1 Tax=Mycobacterium kansasii 662 TaxID=1299326 RepID=X7ZF54_MYCKA|nr:hypothetical protein I545_3158 [Mycobacterium kansasii 662]KEP39590.1 hypothetical protein MKSMC1_52630 [Mycobacterium kansasii]
MATTVVAHPLTMLTAAAATAVQGLGSWPIAAGRGGKWSTRPVASDAAGWREIWVAAESDIAGSGPVGARRMIRVRGSSRDPVGSDGFSGAGGRLAAVTGQPA